MELNFQKEVVRTKEERISAFLSNTIAMLMLTISLLLFLTNPVALILSVVCVVTGKPWEGLLFLLIFISTFICLRTLSVRSDAWIPDEVRQTFRTKKGE